MADDPIDTLKRQVADIIKVEMARHYDAGAAVLMQTDRARVSDIRRGRLQRFSLETLIRYAERLGTDVQLLCTRRKYDQPSIDRSARAATQE